MSEILDTERNHKVEGNSPRIGLATVDSSVQHTTKEGHSTQSQATTGNQSKREKESRKKITPEHVEVGIRIQCHSSAANQPKVLKSMLQYLAHWPLGMFGTPGTILKSYRYMNPTKTKDDYFLTKICEKPTVYMT